jgi:hypothetical protein
MSVSNHNNENYLFKIDEVRKDSICDAFFKWKDLNTFIKSMVSRGINMPDAISEPLGCYCMGYYWNKNDGGDAMTPDGKKVEFKATSNFNYDLSSFGPHCNFDKLVFLRFDLNNNKLYIYDTKIDSQELKTLKVTKTATVGDYQQQGKRPHIRLIEEVIEKRNLEPDCIFNIRKGVIEYKKGEN